MFILCQARIQGPPGMIMIILIMIMMMMMIMIILHQARIQGPQGWDWIMENVWRNKRSTKWRRKRLLLKYEAQTIKDV